MTSLSEEGVRSQNCKSLKRNRDDARKLSEDVTESLDAQSADEGETSQFDESEEGGEPYHFIKNSIH